MEKPKRRGWNDSRVSSSIDSLEFNQIKKLKDMSLPANKISQDKSPQKPQISIRESQHSKLNKFLDDSLMD